MSDLLHQNLMPVQSDKQPSPVSMPSAATIAPTTRMTRLTGVVPVSTITPPVTGYHELVFVCTEDATVGHFAAGGNIATAYTPVADRPVTLYYDPNTKLYYVGAVA